MYDEKKSIDIVLKCLSTRYINSKRKKSTTGENTGGQTPPKQSDQS